jgi:hypothetical protein
MYGLLSTEELAALQGVLFEGSEEAYRVACQAAGAERCRLVHRELAQLCLEAGTELLLRLDRYCPQLG